MTNPNGAALATQAAAHHGLACLTEAWSDVANSNTFASFAQIDLARSLMKSIEAEFSSVKSKSLLF